MAQISVDGAAVDDGGNAMILFLTKDSNTHVTAHWSSYFEADLGQWSTAKTVNPPESDTWLHKLVVSPSGTMYSYTPQGQIYWFDNLDMVWTLFANGPTFPNLANLWILPNDNHVLAVWLDGRRLSLGELGVDGSAPTVGPAGFPALTLRNFTEDICSSGI